MLLRKGRGDIRQRHTKDAQTALEEAMSEALTLNFRRLIWGTKTGSWLTMLPFTVNGVDLGDKEWRDTLFIY